MNLTNKQTKFLRAKAHRLKPVVIVGNAGLSNSVMNEIEARIEHHELIKIRLNASNREERLNMTKKIQSDINAILVTCIGHIAIFYRPSATPEIILP